MSSLTGFGDVNFSIENPQISRSKSPSKLENDLEWQNSPKMKKSQDPFNPGFGTLNPKIQRILPKVNPIIMFDDHEAINNTLLKPNPKERLTKTRKNSRNRFKKIAIHKSSKKSKKLRKSQKQSHIHSNRSRHKSINKSSSHNSNTNSSPNLSPDPKFSSTYYKVSTPCWPIANRVHPTPKAKISQSLRKPLLSLQNLLLQVEPGMKNGVIKLEWIRSRFKGSMNLKIWRGALWRERIVVSTWVRVGVRVELMGLEIQNDSEVFQSKYIVNNLGLKRRLQGNDMVGRVWIGLVDKNNRQEYFFQEGKCGKISWESKFPEKA